MPRGHVSAAICGGHESHFGACAPKAPGPDETQAPGEACSLSCGKDLGKSPRLCPYGWRLRTPWSAGLEAFLVS